MFMPRKFFLAFLPFSLPWLPLRAARDRFAPIDDGAYDSIRRMLNTTEQGKP